MLLNPSMQLMIEKEVDKCYYNLSTTSEVAVFIANEHEKGSCRNIMLVFKKNSELLINL